MKILVKTLLTVALVVSGSVLAATKEIDDAIKQYYAGFPGKAIRMMRPLALAGDVEAQFQLGNIMYSLSATGKYRLYDESIEWYRMAAERDYAPASYAIGVIFQNRWLESKNETDVATSIVYYQKAVDLGYAKAQLYLTKMKSQSGMSPQEAAALIREQEAAPVPKTESRAEANNTDEDNIETAIAATPVDDAASVDIANSSEPVTETAAVAENPNRSAPIADSLDNKITVTLNDIAIQCQNYTKAGFALYAETIKGALFSGNASMVERSPDAVEPGSFSIKLVNSQSNGAVIVSLRKVPEEVARTFI